MNPGLWGAASALSLGCADFAARFTSRGIGAERVLFGTMSLGAVLLSLWIWASGTPLVWHPSSLWLVGLSGLGTAVMTLLLYIALARGPVSIVAPIVASHPVLVVLFWVALGHRPEPLQWAAMALTVLGAVLVARSASGFEGLVGYERAGLRRTIRIALLAALAYTVLVIAGQAAVPVYGELQTLWLGRWVGLAFVLALLLGRGRVPSVPRRWWPLVGLQGTLEVFGYLALFAGSGGEGSTIVAVAGSAFGAVTTLLARVVLREPMSALQWTGVALVFAGVSFLSAGG